MNITSSALSPVKFFRVTVCPATTFGRRKLGAGVPSPSMVDSVCAWPFSLRSIITPPPVLHRALDVSRGHIGVGSLSGELEKLLVRRKAQRDDLRHCQPRIEQFSGHGEMPQVLLGADRTILRLKRKRPAVIEKQA